MCLSSVYDKDKQAKIIKRLTRKGGWITAYKKVLIGSLGNITPLFFHFDFKKGLNISPDRRRITLGAWGYNGDYKPFFHSYRFKNQACLVGKLAVCKIRPSWITAIGIQGDKEIIVSRKIIL